MTTWARNVGGIAVDVVTIDPAKLFHPTLVGQFVIVPDGTLDGWTYDGETWAKPAPPPPEALAAPRVATVSVPDFWLLFSSVEEVAIRVAAANDPIIGVWLRRLDDTRTLTVDLSSPALAEWLAHLTKTGLLASGRTAKILAGQQA